MTTRYMSSCLQASSAVSLVRHTTPHCRGSLHVALRSHNCLAVRSYASQDPPRRETQQHFKPPKALEPSNWRPDTAPVSLSDKINPPSSTRPPPLELPTRGSETVLVYYFRIGKAYGTFYKEGLKAVWQNHKAASTLKKRIFSDLNAKGTQQTKNWRAIREVAVTQGLLTRAEFQLLERNSYDIGKLPFFGVLVLVFGEWLPLLVPFIPGAVPMTCRIPKQIKGMRTKAEYRRRVSFRSGVEEPSDKLVNTKEAEKDGKIDRPPKRAVDIQSMLSKLRNDQLLHLSTTLNLHSGLWDRVQLPPPAVLLRRKVTARLRYLALDDQLLARFGGANRLETEEVVNACDERGMDVLGKKETVLRDSLKAWLERQSEDTGHGSVALEMLFRRPNAWNRLVTN